MKFVEISPDVWVNPVTVSAIVKFNNGYLVGSRVYVVGIATPIFTPNHPARVIELITQEKVKVREEKRE